VTDDPVPYPLRGSDGKIPLMHRRSRRSRLHALWLLLMFLGGSLGLPLGDALIFHSTARTAPAAAPDQLDGGHDSGVAHALGCAFWTIAVSGAGLPGPDQPRTAVVPAVVECEASPQPLRLTQTDISLGHSRAPPSA
jgi:hypothetical protein